MTELYNCKDLAELFTLRKDPRGTEIVDLSELTFQSDQAEMLEWNGYNVYLLAIDGSTAEIFIP